MALIGRSALLLLLTHAFVVGGRVTAIARLDEDPVDAMAFASLHIAPTAAGGAPPAAAAATVADDMAPMPMTAVAFAAVNPDEPANPESAPVAMTFTPLGDAGPDAPDVPDPATSADPTADPTAGPTAAVATPGPTRTAAFLANERRGVPNPYNHYCGRTYGEAKASCSGDVHAVPCPDNLECPDGQGCFAMGSSMCDPATSPPTDAPTSTATDALTAGEGAATDAPTEAGGPSTAPTTELFRLAEERRGASNPANHYCGT